MIQERKQLWIDALLSGKYEQLEGELGAGATRRCCLGVACEVAIEAGAVQRIPNVAGHLRVTGMDEYADEVLPENVASWFGLVSNNPRVQIDGVMAELSIHNDKHNHPFETLAAAIKEQL